MNSLVRSRQCRESSGIGSGGVGGTAVTDCRSKRSSHSYAPLLTGEPALEALHIVEQIETDSGNPALRVGAWDRDRLAIDWWGLVGDFENDSQPRPRQCHHR